MAEELDESIVVEVVIEAAGISPDAVFGAAEIAPERQPDLLRSKIPERDLQRLMEGQSVGPLVAAARPAHPVHEAGRVAPFKLRPDLGLEYPLDLCLAGQRREQALDKTQPGHSVVPDQLQCGYIDVVRPHLAVADDAVTGELETGDAIGSQTQIRNPDRLNGCADISAGPRNGPLTETTQVAVESPTSHPPSAAPSGGRLSDLAYDRILEGLFDRRLPAGAFVSQNELVQLLGVPVAPLRDALRVLEAEGVLTIHPRSGIQFVKPGLELTRSTYQFRAILERAAFSVYAETADEAELAGTARRHRTLMAALEEDGLTADAKADIEALELLLHNAI